MKTLNVAFDVDGCLIDWNQQPNLPVVALIQFFALNTKNARVIVWSKRGKDWADFWVDELCLRDYVFGTGSKEDGWIVDIAFDDQHGFDQANENVIVKL